MFEDIKRMSFRHKNNKPWYYIKSYFRYFLPNSVSSFFFNPEHLENKVKSLDPKDQKYLLDRVNYYNKLNEIKNLPSDVKSLQELRLKDCDQKVYYFDMNQYTRFFSPKMKIIPLFGDITTIPDYPSITKSRPIEGDNRNSVILNMGKIRHFLFVNDPKEFIEKKNLLLFRGKAFQEHRLKFLDMYYQHPLCDVGQVNRDKNAKFPAPRLTISEHLNYKFILCLEGNDVASNLKWVMSSNSVAVMPKPKYETWFMEGRLLPNHHYILIKDDYSDLEERINYYIQNPNECLKIIDNAHQYINQFKNKDREKLISLLVIQKYFDMTGQTTKQ